MSLNQTKMKQKFLLELEKTPIIEAACRKSGLPRATLYRWRNADSKFDQDIEEVLAINRGRYNDLGESQLVSLMKAGNVSAIMFWLRNNHPAYAAKLRIDARVRQESEELTDEQAAVVEKALRFLGSSDDQSDRS